MFLNIDVQELIRRREATGLSMKALSTNAGLPGNAVLRLERGETKRISHLRAREIAKALDCKVEDVFYTPKERNQNMAAKTTYTETRRISATDLRSLCVRMNWYTKGDNDEYGHLLFDLAGNKPHLDTADIIEIAEDIAAHSELDTAAGEDIRLIASLLAGIATTFFEEQKGSELPLYYGASNEAVQAAMKTERELNR